MEPACPSRVARSRCTFSDNSLSKNTFSGWNTTRPDPLTGQNRRGGKPWQTVDHE